MKPLHEKWLSGGRPWSVTTAHIEGESEEQWHTRHEEAVAFWKAVYPED